MCLNTRLLKYILGIISQPASITVYCEQRKQRQETSAVSVELEEQYLYADGRAVLSEL